MKIEETLRVSSQRVSGWMPCYPILEEILPAVPLNTQVADALTKEQEKDLVVRCQDGDKRAMEALILHYQQWVYNIAYGMLGTREDASDMAQEVFLWLWEHIGQFRFRSRFSTWLYRIVTNRCINVKDQKKDGVKPMLWRFDDSQPWVPVDTETPEKSVLRLEQREILQKALAVVEG